MFGKFALFVVVALCAAQSLHAKSIEPEARGIVEDIVKGIKDVIKKIESAVSDIVSNIPNLIGNLQNKIKEIIDKIDLGGILGKIQEKIESILEAAGVGISNAKKCIDAEKADVDQMIKDTTEAIANCKKVADDRTKELINEMEALKTKAHDLITEINSGVKQCFKDNGVNLINLAKCMGTHFDDIKAKADALVKQIADTIATAAKTAGDITVTLAKCTATISKDLIVKEKEIIDNFQKCVDELKQE